MLFYDKQYFCVILFSQYTLLQIKLEIGFYLIYYL